MNGRIHEPIGNRDSSKAPCGCYPCQGKDEWVTIVVASDEEWASLCQVMGREDLVNDSRFADVISRWKNQDEIDRTVSEWTRKQDHYQIMNRLQETGIAAGAVLTVAEIFDDVHMKERDFFPVQTHPEAGTFLCKGKPMRFSKTPLRNDMPAPCLGEHNTFVYGTLLGMSQEEIDGLEREGVIGTVPTSTDLQFT
jgi:benzylsuccinate CoA-transferase BbsF subunit